MPSASARTRAPLAVLAAAFLFNLGQGALRPALPLYLQHVFAANYRMVTLIPVAFGAGKWVASLPTGYLVGRLGRTRLMTAGLLVIAGCDIAAVMARGFGVFLGIRAVGGAGWAMFGTVATLTMVDTPGGHRRGRAINLLLMSETLGLLLGSAGGGWLYQGVGIASPFLFEAACMLLAAVAVARRVDDHRPGGPPARGPRDGNPLGTVLRVPGVLLMGVIAAALAAIQTGALVFLFPLHVVERGGLGPEAVGHVVALGVLGRLLALWLGAGVSDRWGRMPVLIVGLAGYGVLVASLALVTEPGLLAMWSFLVGAGGGLVAGVPAAVIGDRVPPSLHGIAIGWLRTATDTGMLAGPLMLGALADAVHLSTPFVVSGALMIALAGRCHRRSGETPPGR